MYIVYTIDYNTHDVKVKNIIETEEEAKEMMKQLALKFMAHEEGGRKARIITETPLDTSDIIKGFFLFSPDPKKIDVYHKDIIKVSHIIWGEVPKTTESKIKAYSYTKVSEDDDEDIEENDNPMEEE